MPHATIRHAETYRVNALYFYMIQNKCDHLSKPSQGSPRPGDSVIKQSVNTCQCHRSRSMAGWIPMRPQTPGKSIPCWSHMHDMESQCDKYISRKRHSVIWNYLGFDVWEVVVYDETICS